MRLRGVDLSELIELIAEAIEQYMKDNPDFSVDEAAAAVSFVQGTLFRVASEIPAKKLH